VRGREGAGGECENYGAAQRLMGRVGMCVQPGTPERRREKTGGGREGGVRFNRGREGAIQGGGLLKAFSQGTGGTNTSWDVCPNGGRSYRHLDQKKEGIHGQVCKNQKKSDL